MRSTKNLLKLCIVIDSSLELTKQLIFHQSIYLSKLEIMYICQSFSDQFLQQWKFTKSFSPCNSWHWAGPNPLAEHLKVCPFYGCREMNQEVRSYVPIEEVPLDEQIKNMLQVHLQEHRC